VLFNWNDSRESIFRAIEAAKRIGIDKISFWFTLSPVLGVSRRYIFKNRFYAQLSRKYPTKRFPDRFEVNLDTGD